jgi:hypothetical protein
VSAAAADVRLEAPELVSLGNQEIDNAIASATLEVNADSWGTLATRGIVVLAAHLLAEAHPELYLGERVPERPDPPEGAGAYGSTVYGVRYWRMRKTTQYAGGGLLA